MVDSFNNIYSIYSFYSFLQRFIFFWCIACVLFEKLCEEALVGEVEAVAHIFYRHRLHAQHAFGFEDDILVDPICCILSADLMYYARQIFGRYAEFVRIERYCAVGQVVVLDQFDEVDEQLLSAALWLFVGYVFSIVGKVMKEVAEHDVEVALGHFFLETVVWCA